MVMMVVAVMPMVTMMSSVPLDDDNFPVFPGFVMRRVGRGAVLGQKRRKIQDGQEQDEEQFLHNI
jgi:hypothetical protein